MPYIAHFQAEAWMRDYAVPVDAEGPEEWDCTAELLRLVQPGVLTPGPLTLAEVDASIAEDGDWQDNDDVLKGDPASPEWIREWRGPFTITVTMEGEV